MNGCGSSLIPNDTELPPLLPVSSTSYASDSDHRVLNNGRNYILAGTGVQKRRRICLWWQSPAESGALNLGDGALLLFNLFFIFQTTHNYDVREYPQRHSGPFFGCLSLSLSPHLLGNHEFNCNYDL